MNESPETSPRRRGVSRLGRAVYERHGLRGLQRAVEQQGLAVADARTPVAAVVREWREALVGDLGGAEAVTAGQRALVDMAAKSFLYVLHVDHWLAEQPSIINRTRRELLAVVLQRQKLVDGLTAQLRLIGLERRAKTLPTPLQYVNGVAVTAPLPPAEAVPEALGAPQDAPAAPEGEASQPFSRPDAPQTSEGPSS